MKHNTDEIVKTIITSFESQAKDIAKGLTTANVRRYQTAIRLDKNGKQIGGNIAAQVTDAPVIRWFNSRVKTYNEINSTTLTALQFAKKVSQFEKLASLFGAYKITSDVDVNKQAGLMTASIRKSFDVPADVTFTHVQLFKVLKSAAKFYASIAEWKPSTKTQTAKIVKVETPEQAAMVKQFMAAQKLNPQAFEQLLQVSTTA